MPRFPVGIPPVFAASLVLLSLVLVSGASLGAHQHEGIVHRHPHPAESRSPHAADSRRPHETTHHAKPQKPPKRQVAMHVKPPKVPKH